MGKYMLAFFAISLLASMENSSAMGYMQPQGGYGQPYPMNPSCQQCRSYLEQKYQKNIQEAQQEAMECQQGDFHECQKSQKDRMDAQRYLMQYNNCPCR